MPADDDAQGRQRPHIEISGVMPEWAPFHDFIIRCLQASAARLDLSETEISVHLCDDAEMSSLNKTYRGKDGSTNVLSFAPVDVGDAPDGEHLLGDIVLAYETLVLEAAEQGKAFEAHLAHLLVHGLLHLLGHDHQNDAEATIMETQEISLLADLGFANPYQETSDELAKSGLSHLEQSA